MRRFVQLFEELDRTTRTSEKQAALERYFREAPPEDAAWALHILLGRGLIRAINRTNLREWVAEQAGVPLWMVDECRGAVGDFSETLALLLPDVSGADAHVEQQTGELGSGTDRPLHRVVTESILPLAQMDAARQRQVLIACWREFDRTQRFIYHKLISGVFRVGAAARLVTRALANVAEVEPAFMAHRLMGGWRATGDEYLRLISAAEAHDDPSQPYPFCLAYPLEDLFRSGAAAIPETAQLESPDGSGEFEALDSQAGQPADPLTRIAEKLGNAAEWLTEWKWDGVRAQLIRRQGQTWMWSRGQELISDTYPELIHASTALPDGTVLDGEILAWENERPLPFNTLQHRVNRKQVEVSFWPEVPIAFLAFDLLELNGRDVRNEPLSARRSALERLLTEAQNRDHRYRPATFPIRLTTLLNAQSWQQLSEMRLASRERGTEGLMLKRLDSAYGAGRQRGLWWKWKIDPFTIDAVLIYAQLGNGKRAMLFTDYTFGVWEQGELVPVAKAYSGLTDEEIREVDRFVRTNTLERHGPFRHVKPALVFELGFEAIQESRRHRAGLAVRFPRMLRWRKDKLPHEADRLDTLRALLQAPQAAAAKRTR